MIKIGNTANHISVYTAQPKNKYELKKIIEERIIKEGPNCDLNDIDVSLIEDMYCMFYDSEFNGDISNWNVSNVEDMSYTFNYSSFTGDISRWDVSSVKTMENMFYESSFNKDISNWEISRNCNTKYMFNGCPIKNEYKPKILQQ